MTPPTNSHEILVGLQVSDDDRYARYREGMTPILESYGGSFRYDFRIAEVLRSASDQPINRVFVIAFPDTQTKEAFFADPAYLAVREEFFDGAVDAISTLAEYDRARGD